MTGETRQQRRERERRQADGLREAPKGLSREAYLDWVRRTVRDSALKGRLDGSGDGFALWLPSMLSTLVKHLGDYDAVLALAQDLADEEGAAVVLLGLTPGHGLREIAGGLTQAPIRLHSVAPDSWSAEREQRVLQDARARVQAMTTEGPLQAVLASELATAPYEVRGDG